MRKYGPDTFTLTVLEDDITADQLAAREQHYIVAHHTRTTEHGYNATAGGDGMCGWVMPDATRAKVSKNRTGKGTGANNGLYGVGHTEETKRKISQAATGRTHSEQSRLINSLSKTGNKNHFFGKKHSEHTRSLISQKAKGRVAWNKGIPRSPELIARMVEGRRLGRLARQAATCQAMAESASSAQ